MRFRAPGWRTKIWSIVVSLALSFFLWLVLAGQNMKTVEMSASLELIGVPENLGLNSELPNTVVVQLLANTAQMRLLDDRKLHLSLDAGSSTDGDNTLPLDTDSLDLPRGVQVRKVTPSTVTFTLKKFTARLIPLTPVTTGQPGPFFRLKSITLQPSHVTVKGPEDLLKGINSLPTYPVDISGLKLSLNRKVATDLSAFGGNDIISIPVEIQAFINIEERREAKIFTALPLQISFKNGVGLKTDDMTVNPEEVAIEVSWPASRREPVIALNIKPRVEVAGEQLKKSRKMTLPVLVAAPKGVTVMSINPVHVEVDYIPPPVAELSAPANTPLSTQSNTTNIIEDPQ